MSRENQPMHFFYIFIGGGVAFGLTISAFMADITTPETLTFRLFMVGIPSALAGNTGC